MELTANHTDLELERRLRLEMLEAWDKFAQASRESKELPCISADHEPAKSRDFDSFFRYQRAFKRFSDLIVFGKIPNGPA